MARSQKLRVMISSRCSDKFPEGTEGRLLSEIRRELKLEIESLEIFGKKVFEVWINEDAPPAPGGENSWEHCMKQVKQCDILLALVNGNAGWAMTSGEIGICHAELSTGLSQSPGKVYLISLGKITAKIKSDRIRNERFQAFIDAQSPFRGREAKSVDDLKNIVKEALHAALISLAQAGVREIGKGKFHTGQALDWSRMDFKGRRDVMVNVVVDVFAERAGGAKVDEYISLSLEGEEILIVPHAVPASFSEPQAKAMVGQPFLLDHKLVKVLGKKRVGPVHVIACQKTITESQATRLLGFPDATVINAPFGIYVADDVQKVQFAFIADCRDETTTRHGVQRFLEWLDQSGEAVLMAKRAANRAKIVKVIAEVAS